MPRDLCPKCNSTTALGDARCFKCGFRQKVWSSMRHMDRSYNSTDLPDNIVFTPHNFHLEAIEWLAKAHIYNDIIIFMGIGYCPEIHKVFIPAYNDKAELQFYQLRSLDKGADKKYKYLTYGSSSRYTIHYKDHPSASSVVFVEDHLSAIRLRNHMNVVALSGTSLQQYITLQLVQQYSDFIFWLDPDEAGKKATFKNITRIKNAAELTNRRILMCGGDEFIYSFGYINYDKIREDPKRYTDSQIATILTTEVIPCQTIYKPHSQKSMIKQRD